MTESRVELGGRTWAIRETGDPSGRPLVYFHGTPSCRLEAAFADATCAELGVRLISFDRPGYGASTAQPFGLVSLANATAAVADRLGIGRFTTLGQSGGGPFSLACATVLGDRVVRAGVTAGAVPFQLVPGGYGHRYFETETVPAWAGIMGLDPDADYSRIEAAIREANQGATG